jgi:hypothetical protein
MASASTIETCDRMGAQAKYLSDVIKLSLAPPKLPGNQEASVVTPNSNADRRSRKCFPMALPYVEASQSRCHSGSIRGWKARSSRSWFTSACRI